MILVQEWCYRALLAAAPACECFRACHKSEPLCQWMLRVRAAFVPQWCYRALLAAAPIWWGLSTRLGLSLRVQPSIYDSCLQVRSPKSESFCVYFLGRGVYFLSRWVYFLNRSVYFLGRGVDF